MSPFVSRTLLATATVATLGLIGPTGCADNRSTLYVVGVLARPDDCSGYLYDPGQPRIGSGLMDTLMARSYVAGLLIGNQMVPQGNNDQVRTETSRVQLQGAEVRLTRVGGDEVAHYTTAISGTVDPSPSTNPGFFGAQVMLIPPGLDLADGEYLSSVRVFGETLGGQDVETGEFVFPILVCYRCSLKLEGTATSDGVCAPPAGEVAADCHAGLDGRTECSTCQSVLGPDPRCVPTR